MKKTIVITGGAGYIGSCLTNSLINKDVSVVVIDNLATSTKTNVNPKAKFYNLDISSPQVYAILQKEKPCAIFHMAASKSVNESVNNPVEFTRINVLGSINVIQSAYRLGIKRFIFTSTAGVYGDGTRGKKQKENDPIAPSSPYAWSKYAIERYLTYMNTLGMESVIVRFANVYGPGGKSHFKSVVNIFVESLLTGKEIDLHGNGNQTRDFVYIQDLIDFCEHLLDVEFSKIKESPIFNVSTGKEVSIHKLLLLIAKAANKHPKISYRKHIFSGQTRSVLDPHRSSILLGWSAKTTLEQGIQQMIGTKRKGSL